MTVTFYTIEPVKVCITRLNLSDQFAISIKQLVICLVVDVTLYKVRNQVCSSISCSFCFAIAHCWVAHCIILITQPFSFHPTVCIQTVIFCDTTVVEALVNLQCYCWATGVSTSLGSNDNYTIGGTVTIKSSRSRILQYRDGFDIVRRDIIDVTIVWNTIYNIKRSGFACDCTDTTN